MVVGERKRPPCKRFHVGLLLIVFSLLLKGLRAVWEPQQVQALFSTRPMQEGMRSAGGLLRAQGCDDARMDLGDKTVSPYLEKKRKKEADGNVNLHVM